MLKNFWWPLAFSSEVSRKPIRVTALQEEFVAYRLPDGRANVLSDLCVHRGGALSDGWTQGDRIVCPYHGWEFRADGACVRIPANPPDAPVPRKARVDAYPTVEQMGWVWAFLGDIPAAERPPMPTLQDAGAAMILSGAITWRAPYERVIAHLVQLPIAMLALDGEFAPEAPQFSALHAAETPWGARLTAMLTPPPYLVRGWLGLTRRRVPALSCEVSVAFHMPCITLCRAGDDHMMMAHVPVNPETTTTRWMVARRSSQTNAEVARRRVMAALERLRPEVEGQPAPETLLFCTFRRLRDEAIARGWGIDAHLIQAEYANIKAVVIPSPARREVPELAAAWVMKEAPTIQPRDA
ncbi:MAG: hypothetical protein KatS3mg052_0905 [Candidatus Roseilinea sp.]|nr:MAG: hypothetical protein KatS3mg052_0905 [Candidatus Roseilinea sp.]